MDTRILLILQGRFVQLPHSLQLRPQPHTSTNGCASFTWLSLLRYCGQEWVWWTYCSYIAFSPYTVYSLLSPSSCWACISVWHETLGGQAGYRLHHGVRLINVSIWLACDGGILLAIKVLAAQRSEICVMFVFLPMYTWTTTRDALSIQLVWVLHSETCW